MPVAVNFLPWLIGFCTVHCSGRAERCGSAASDDDDRTNYVSEHVLKVRLLQSVSLST